MSTEKLQALRHKASNSPTPNRSTPLSQQALQQDDTDDGTDADDDDTLPRPRRHPFESIFSHMLPNPPPPHRAGLFNR